jgi:hypothetical protein
MKLQNHPKLIDAWPPQPGGAFDASYVAPLESQDVLEEVLLQRAVGTGRPCIALRTIYLGKPHTRDLFVSNDDFAKRLSDRLCQHKGETVERIGDLEVDF